MGVPFPSLEAWESATAAIGSNMFEGYEPTRRGIEIISDYTTGKISFDTFIRAAVFKGAWKALGTLAPERLTALRRVATIESVGSSTRIEGSKLSDRQVESLLARLSIHTFASRDEQEVAGYAETMEQIFQSWEHIPLTENHIHQLHRDLLRHSDKDVRHRGQYKHAPNSVAAFDAHGRQIGIVFETTSPFDTSRLMQGLVEWTNAAFDARELHPLLIIGMFAVCFLAIHPFQDGNGRLHTFAASVRVCLYALQFIGKRHREQQRELLSRLATNTDEPPNGFARLAALAAFLPPCLAPADEAP